jgi:hypothetical protein
MHLCETIRKRRDRLTALTIAKRAVTCQSRSRVTSGGQPNQISWAADFLRLRVCALTISSAAQSQRHLVFLTVFYCIDDTVAIGLAFSRRPLVKDFSS